MSSNAAGDRPHLSFVNGTVKGALDTLDRVNLVNTYVPSVTYANNGLALALRTEPRPMDMGEMNDRLFVNVAGVGFVLAVDVRIECTHTRTELLHRHSCSQHNTHHSASVACTTRRESRVFARVK